MAAGTRRRFAAWRPKTSDQRWRERAAPTHGDREGQCSAAADGEGGARADRAGWSRRRACCSAPRARCAPRARRPTCGAPVPGQSLLHWCASAPCCAQMSGIEAKGCVIERAYLAHDDEQGCDVYTALNRAARLQRQQLLEVADTARPGSGWHCVLPLRDCKSPSCSLFAQAASSTWRRCATGRARSSSRRRCRRATAPSCACGRGSRYRRART